MFELSMPWWEFPARAAVIYVVLLVLVRLSGKRTIGQFTRSGSTSWSPSPRRAAASCRK